MSSFGSLRPVAYRIATSASPACRSRTLSVPMTSSGASGRTFLQRGSRGTSHRLAKAFVVVTRRGCRSPWRLIAPSATEKASRPSRTTGNSRAPASVNESGLGRRRNRALPQYCSNSRIWWLIAVGVTPSSAAAFLKLTCRAAASKARSSMRGGNLFIDSSVDERFSSSTKFFAFAPRPVAVEKQSGPQRNSVS